MRHLGTVVAATIAAGLVALTPAVARAEYIPGPRGASNSGAQVVLGQATTATGQTIRGFVGPATFNPLAGYPPITPNPPAGFTPAENGDLIYAGAIPATTQPAGQAVTLYCVDLHVSTEAGLGYDAAAWSVTDVPNIAFVNRIVQTYYPSSTLPAGATSNAQRAAAVQAAIWFFTDNFAVGTSTAAGAALYPLVASIVSAVLAAGPLNTEPPLPQVTITGPATGAAETVLGPYTVHTTATEATVTVTGAQVFADAAGTQPLPNTFTRPAGGTFFLRTDDPATVTIHASAVATAFAGATAGYVAADPNNPEPAQAQKLVFAQNAQVNVATTRTITTTEAAGEEDEGEEGLPATGVPAGAYALIGFGLAGAGAVFAGLARIRRRP
jgi:hypothetical protein